MRDDGTKATKFNPPQPALFAVIIDGIMTGELPWGLVILGAFLAIVIWLAGVSPLAFAVGVYLPLSTTLPIFIGGLVRGAVDRFRKMTPEESDSSPAVLMSSGLIAGGSMAGILIALLAFCPWLVNYFYYRPPAQGDRRRRRSGRRRPGPVRTASSIAIVEPRRNQPTTRSPATYLVNDQGQPLYRVEVSSMLDLSRRLGFPRDWESRPLPGVLAFCRWLILLWVGLRSARCHHGLPWPRLDADLARRGEISDRSRTP